METDNIYFNDTDAIRLTDYRSVKYKHDDQILNLRPVVVSPIDFNMSGSYPNISFNVISQDLITKQYFSSNFDFSFGFNGAELDSQDTFEIYKTSTKRTRLTKSDFSHKKPKTVKRKRYKCTRINK